MNQNTDTVASLTQRLSDTALRNLRSAFVCAPGFGIVLVAAHKMGGHMEIERLSSAAIGFSLGWGFGMLALYWATKQPKPASYCKRCGGTGGVVASWGKMTSCDDCRGTGIAPNP